MTSIYRRLHFDRREARFSLPISWVTPSPADEYVAAICLLTIRLSIVGRLERSAFAAKPFPPLSSFRTIQPVHG
jgi:hypothetical protein